MLALVQRENAPILKKADAPEQCVAVWLCSLCMWWGMGGDILVPQIQSKDLWQAPFLPEALKAHT